MEGVIVLFCTPVYLHTIHYITTATCTPILDTLGTSACVGCGVRVGANFIQRTSYCRCLPWEIHGETESKLGFLFWCSMGLDLGFVVGHECYTCCHYPTQ